LGEAMISAILNKMSKQKKKMIGITSTDSIRVGRSRSNLQLVTAADFNNKLRERGCPRKVTVQKVCRQARDEDEVRETLGSVWK